MRNPLTFRIESGLGATLITISAVLCMSLLFIAIKNFNTDIDILSVDYATLDSGREKSDFLTPFEKNLINTWLGENRIVIPEGRGYKYIVREYPSRPWLKLVE